MATIANPTFQDRAVELLGRGFSLIPLQPSGKAPIHGIGAKSKTKDPAVIQSWAEQFPEANVGVVADNDICIVESDDLGALRTIVKNSTGKDLPQTLSACGSSENRPHFFFKHTEKSRNIGCLQVPGLFEARFVNQYVVAPGSIHPNGAVYRWLNDAPIVEIPDWLVSELARLALTQKTDRKNPVVQAGPDGRIPEGGRHYELFRQLGKQWTGEQTEEELLEWARDWNDQNCNPPMEEWRVCNDVRDIMKREPYQPGPKVLLLGSKASQIEPNGNIDPDSWRTLFHTYEEAVNAPPLKFAIRNFLQEEGITMLGGLAGHGKTLIMLNVVKALLEGDPLFGYEGFQVERPSKRVVYLVPESGLGPFVHRLKLFRLLEHVKSDRLLFRTLSASGDLSLSEPAVKRAVEGADVFLDTAIRFMDGDENSASDQKAFAKTLFELQRCGARTIVGAHHSPKAFGKAEGISLENTLRGSGDVGAMLCTAWAVKQTDEALNEIYVRNVKARDFIACGSFRLTGRPFIDQQGSFVMTTAPGEAEAPKVEKLNKKQGQQAEAKVMLAAGHEMPAIAKQIGVSERTLWRWKTSGVLTD